MTKIGYLSVKTHPREARVARVRVNGIDVTRLCVAADDTEGWAECFVRDATGRLVVVSTPDGAAVARERLRGEVLIDFPRGLD